VALDVPSAKYLEHGAHFWEHSVNACNNAKSKNRPYIISSKSRIAERTSRSCRTNLLNIPAYTDRSWAAAAACLLRARLSWYFATRLWGSNRRTAQKSLAASAKYCRPRFAWPPIQSSYHITVYLKACQIKTVKRSVNYTYIPLVKFEKNKRALRQCKRYVNFFPLCSPTESTMFARDLPYLAIVKNPPYMANLAHNLLQFLGIFTTFY